MFPEGEQTRKHCFRKVSKQGNCLFFYTYFPKMDKPLGVGLSDIKKNHLTIIVEEIIAIFDNIAINAIKTMISNTTN
jgi:hypothetical protein